MYTGVRTSRTRDWGRAGRGGERREAWGQRMTTEDETSAKRLEPTEDGTTGSSGGAGSDDCGRSTHPEVAPSHGRPAREHRVGLRPDDERAHGARATGAARAIARARISSVPTTTSAGDSNTRETIDVRARITESRSEVEPDTPSSALLLPQRPARGGTARRGIPLRARMSDAGRAAIVFGVIPLSSALLCWVAMGWWSVKTRRDRRRVATLRHRASARPSPSSRTTSERAPPSPSLTPRTPPPPSSLPPPPSARRRRLIERLAGDSATTAAPGAGASRGASRGPTPPTPRDPVVALSAYEIDALERGSPRAEDSPTPRDSLGGAGDDDAGDKDSAFDQGWAGEEGALADRFRLLEDVRSTLGDMSDRYSVIFERMEDAESRREGGDGEGRSRRGERPSRNRA